MKNKSELECVNVKKLLYSYIDNELTQIQSSSVKEHIKECEVCKNNYNNILKIKNMIKQSYEPKENIDFSKKIMANIAYNNKYDSSEHDDEKSIKGINFAPRNIVKKVIYLTAAASVLLIVAGATVKYFEEQMPVSKEVAIKTYDKYEDYVLEHYTNSYAGPNHQASVISVNFEK